MASIDIYVNPWQTGQNIVANSLGGLSQGSGSQGTNMPKLSHAAWDQGATVRRLYATWSKGTEASGTIYRIFRSLSGSIIPLSIRLACSAITGLSSVSCGLYKSGQIIPGGPVGTAAINSACFASAVNVAAGAATLKEATAFDMLALGGLANPNNLHTRLFEYAGMTVYNNIDKFDLALTLNTDAGNTGWMAVLFEFIQG